jgi:spore maturation protein CgeB
MPDMGYWYLYHPLVEMGHEVRWYDTVAPEETDYNKVIEQFKPDLIFCCMTGDFSIAPYEPWRTITNETQSGRTKTFNWFCDDTWRFDSFSNIACRSFNICSTPEPDYLDKYRSIGYNNIILGAWHANSSFYPKIDFKDKDLDISFVGNLTPSRKLFFDSAEISIENIFGVSNEELFSIYARSKIGINLSTNGNDPWKKTQMKQRMFEIPAAHSLLVTEHHDAIQYFYQIDKEIITFRTIDEFKKKCEFLFKNPTVVKKIAENGYKRFMREHDSKVRLKEVLKEIGKC